MGIIFVVFVLLETFSNNKLSNKIKPFLLISLIILGIGIFFKTLHWAYGNELLIAAIGLITIVFIAQLLIQKNKNPEDCLKTVFVVTLGLASLATAMHWHGKEIFTIIAMIFFVLYLGLISIKFFKSSSKNAR